MVARGAHVGFAVSAESFVIGALARQVAELAIAVKVVGAGGSTREERIERMARELVISMAAGANGWAEDEAAVESRIPRLAFQMAEAFEAEAEKRRKKE